MRENRDFRNFAWWERYYPGEFHHNRLATKVQENEPNSRVPKK
jgi:hypothetical protein